MSNLEKLQAKLDEMGVAGVRGSTTDKNYLDINSYAAQLLTAIEQFEQGNFREFNDPVQETRTEGDSERDTIYSNNMKMFIKD